MPGFNLQSDQSKLRLYRDIVWLLRGELPTFSTFAVLNAAVCACAVAAIPKHTSNANAAYPPQPRQKKANRSRTEFIKDDDTAGRRKLNMTRSDETKISSLQEPWQNLGAVLRGEVQKKEQAFYTLDSCLYSERMASRGYHF
jgi:hypothetical protein